MKVDHMHTKSFDTKLMRNEVIQLQKYFILINNMNYIFVLLWFKTEL